MRKLRKDVEKSQKFARDLRENMTEAEHRLWHYLRRKHVHGFRFRRQHPIGPYIADFACVGERLIVEADGDTHSTEIEIAHDKRRSEFLIHQKWRIVRYSNGDIYNHIDDVLNDVYAHLKGMK